MQTPDAQEDNKHYAISAVCLFYSVSNFLLLISYLYCRLSSTCAMPPTP
jgi:hypothetical protein